MKRLETLTVAITKQGHRYLTEDVYFEHRRGDRPLLHMCQYNEVDDEDYVRLSIMLREGRLYTK